MDVTRLRLWCQTHDLVVSFEAEGKTYRIDAEGLHCCRSGGEESRVREGQLIDVLERHPELQFSVVKRALRGMENLWSREEIEEAIEREP